MKLNRGDKTAIRKSIAHWRRMRGDARGAGESPTGGGCALCKKYPRLICLDDANRKCPVLRVSGRNGCVDTPHREADAAWRVYVIAKKDSARERWEKAADAEIEFLQGLLK